MSKDYYQILGIEKSATKEQIKKAFKKLALKYHPDRAPEDKKQEYEAKFKEINEAVSILGDEKKRQQYDQFGSDAFSGQAGHHGFDFSDVMSQFRSGSFGNFDDIFDQLFGGGRRTQRTRRGSDLLYETEITLEQAATETKQDIQLNKLEHCPQCQGKGAQSFQECRHCQGSGHIKRTQRTPFGLFQQTGPCPYCHGKGELPEDSCKSCGGEGLTRKKKTIEITIPAGVQNGMKLRVPGEGQAGEHGGPSGDLYIQIYISPHQIFERIDQDIHLTIPISFTQASLGDEIEVPTLTNTAKLKIPAGTQSETVFRMRDQGLPYLNHPSSGDQMVKVTIQVPTKLTKKQKDLIKQLKEEPPHQSFLKKIFG